MWATQHQESFLASAEPHELLFLGNPDNPSPPISPANESKDTEQKKKAPGNRQQQPKAVERTIEVLSKPRGVAGVVVYDSQGNVIRTTLEPESAAKYADVAIQLMHRVAACRVDDEQDVPTFFALRTRKHEIVIRHSDDQALGILVLQNPDAIDEPKINLKVLREKLRGLGVDIPRGADRKWLLELLENEMIRRGT